MTTSALCGYTGSVTGPSGVTEVTQWDITLNVDAQEATSFASTAGWREKIACLKGGSGTFRSIGEPSTIGAHNGSFVTSSLGGGVTIGGGIIINKIDHDTPVNGIVSFTHSFVFTGNITGGILI